MSASQPAAFPSSSAPQRGRRGVEIIVIAAALAAVLLGIVGFEINRRYHTTLTIAEQRTRDMSALASEHMARSMEAVDRALQQSARVAKALYEGRRSRDAATEDLNTVFGSATAIDWISVVNREGRRVIGSSQMTTINLDVSQQQPYLFHSNNDTEQMMISHPFVSKVTQHKSVIASRRVTADDGTFIGLVSAHLDLDYFIRLYQSMGLGETGSFFVTLDDGTTLIRTPADEALVGQPIAPFAVFYGILAQGPTGKAWMISPVDGMERLLIFRRVPNSALVIGTSIAVEEVLADWKRNSVIGGMVMASLALAVLLGGMLLASSMQRADQREYQLGLAKQEAEEASRAKSEFLAIMSHELRTPMNGVIGYTNLLSGLKLDARGQGYVNIIRESATNLLSIVNDILDYSKLDAGKVVLDPQATDLPRLLEEVKALNKLAAESKKLDLRLKIDPRLSTPLVCDTMRLRQVLINLVGNAIKFTGAGHVTISASLEAEGEGRSSVLFAITDTGVGISADDIPRLFHSFTQADSTIGRRFGGTGLGLAICKSLVELMGGAIGVSSVPDIGSTFWFTLDLPRAAAPARAAASHADEKAVRTGRILVVDDNTINRRLVTAVLTPAGNTVVDASSGEEALRRLEIEDFDLVLMDLNMPVMNGLEATAKIRALPSPKGQVPVIALSASAMAEEIARCHDAGMNGHVAKPIDVPQLLRTVSEIMDRAA